MKHQNNIIRTYYYITNKFNKQYLMYTLLLIIIDIIKQIVIWVFYQIYYIKIVNNIPKYNKSIKLKIIN